MNCDAEHAITAEAIEVAARSYMTPAQAADYLGVSKGYLDKGRSLGDGPPFCAFGRKVMYRRVDLDDWAAARVKRSTKKEEIA